MAPSKDNEELAADLARSLQATTNMMQNLMGEIRDNATSLAILKNQIQNMNEHIGSLSQIVKDGNGYSLITKIALIEQSHVIIKEEILRLKQEVIENKLKSENDDKELKDEYVGALEEQNRFAQNKSLSNIKLIGMISPGIIALVLELSKWVFSFINSFGR